MTQSISDRLMETMQQIQAVNTASSEAINEIGDESFGEAMLPAEMPDCTINPIQTNLEDEPSSDIKTDYTRAREYTYALQDIGLIMLKNAAQMAVATQQPKAYTSVNELMNTMRNLNKDLMDIQKSVMDGTKKKRELPAPEVKEEEGDENDLEVTALKITGKKMSTQNVIDVMAKLMAQGKDVNSMSNEEIMEAAIVIEGECSNGGEAESNRDDT